MSRPASLTLDDDFGTGKSLAGFGRDRLGAGPDHDCRHRAPGLAHGLEHMSEQRPAGDRVQYLRPRRAHARALAGREHNGKTSAPSLAFGHLLPRQ
jgi:hypothetical protein